MFHRHDARSAVHLHAHSTCEFRWVNDILHSTQTTKWHILAAEMVFTIFFCCAANKNGEIAVWLPHCKISSIKSIDQTPGAHSTAHAEVNTLVACNSKTTVLPST